MSEDAVTDGLLSNKDAVLLILAENGGSLEVSDAELARRLNNRDTSDLRRDLKELKAEFLIIPLDSGEGYELTGQGWRRLEPLTFVTTFLFGALGGLLAGITAIGFAYDFFHIPVLHYGLESSAVASAILLLWLYRQERIGRSLLLRRKKLLRKARKKAVKLT